MSNSKTFLNTVADTIVNIISLAGICGKKNKDMRRAVQALCKAYTKYNIENIMASLDCIVNIINTQAYNEQITEWIMNDIVSIRYLKAMYFTTQSIHIDNNGLIHNHQSHIMDNYGDEKI